MDPTLASLKLRVSFAKESDRSSVARLCRRAVGKSDYVLRILPAIVTRGTLFLAWSGTALIGMTNFDRSIDGSGWLTAARTDPDWRGRGVATYLQGRIASYARQRGIRTLRLWVLSGNTPSLRACERGGFRQVCEAAHISSNLRPAKSNRYDSASFLSGEKMRALLKSSYVAKTSGYIGYRRHFLKFSKTLLNKLLDEGEVYTSGDETLLVSRPEKTFRAPQSSLAVLEGRFGNSLVAGRQIARHMGAQIVSSYIPYSAYELSVAKRHGFINSPWGNHCLVFEKRI